jgi:hypothetical protein
VRNYVGEYDRKLLTGLSIEARIPKLSLFQGFKIPQVSLENRVDSIALPLSSGFHKIVVSTIGQVKGNLFRPDPKRPECSRVGKAVNRVLATVCN